MRAATTSSSAGPAATCARARPSQAVRQVVGCDDAPIGRLRRLPVALRGQRRGPRSAGRPRSRDRRAAASSGGREGLGPVPFPRRDHGVLVGEGRRLGAHQLQHGCGTDQHQQDQRELCSARGPPDPMPAAGRAPRRLVASSTAMGKPISRATVGMVCVSTNDVERRDRSSRRPRPRPSGGVRSRRRRRARHEQPGHGRQRRRRRPAGRRGPAPRRSGGTGCARAAGSRSSSPGSVKATRRTIHVPGPWPSSGRLLEHAQRRRPSTSGRPPSP